MTEVAELLKVWMEESKRQEERREEERKRYEEERKQADERYQEVLRRRDEEEKRREAERQKEREDDRKRYEELIKEVTEARKKRIEVVGPESLKLTKLADSEDVEAFLTAFVEAHNVDSSQWAALLAPQLTGKALQAYAAMSNDEAKDYQQVKEAIFRRYDINEETYRRRLRSVVWKTNESPMEMLTRIIDLTGKWLKSSDTREKVLDTIIQEQFIDVLPKEARVWVKERKPTSSADAGKLAEDFRQARKETWDRVGKRCHLCKKIGHLAKDCYQNRENNGDKRSTSAETPEDTRRKSIICFNRGHISRNCPNALFCGVKERRIQDLLCMGEVEGQQVNDIQLDTGCSRTLVRKDLVDKQRMLGGETVTIQCAHGDIASYPLAKVEMMVLGKHIVVEAAVSETLPRSVLLGTDVQELTELVGKLEKQNGSKVFAVLTRSQTRKELREQEELQRREKESGVKPTSLEEHSEEVNNNNLEEQSEEELLDTQDKEDMDNWEDEEQLDTQDKEDTEEKGDYYFGTEFADDIFLEPVRQSKRCEKRQNRLQHAITNREKNMELDWVLSLSKEELRRLQENDKTIKDLENKQEFIKRGGLLYHQWRPKRQSGEPIEQLVLPTSCRRTILELAHRIPFAGHMGRDKTARRIQQRFYWPTLFKDVADYCRRCPVCQKVGTQGQRKVPLVPLPIMQEPFERIAMDIVGPLPRSRKGHSSDLRLRHKVPRSHSS